MAQRDEKQSWRKKRETELEKETGERARDRGGERDWTEGLETELEKEAGDCAAERGGTEGRETELEKEAGLRDGRLCWRKRRD